MKKPFGATGEFPEGKLDPDDEGALRLGVATDYRNQVVRIDFGKQVIWLGLPKKEAMLIAELIRKHAAELD